MIFRVAAIALLVVIGTYAWLQFRRAPLIAIMGVISALAGAYFVVFPEHATAVAGWLGIGRGADFILYIWLLLSLMLLLNVHVKLRSTQIQMTRLARHIALMEAHRNSTYPAGAATRSQKEPGRSEDCSP